MIAPVSVYVKSNPTTTSETGETPSYKTNAGIPFECVEFVRRYFMQTHDLTFPSVVDATDIFYRIHKFVSFNSDSSTPGSIHASKSVHLRTYIYPYVKPALHYLRPGTMLFWVPEPTDELKYGHVALVVDANAEYVVVAQQNRLPPIQAYDTRELFNAINSPNSEYLGVKLVSQ